MDQTAVRKALAWLAAFTERYILSLIYFYFTYLQWNDARYDVSFGFRAGLPYFTPDVTMLALDAIMGAVLLASRQPSSAPRSFREIAVPLAASYFFLLFQYVPDLPPTVWLLKVNHIPPDWRFIGDYLSLMLGTFGTILSLWGILSLGRSFGIFVAVRNVVLHGPYQYVRHPMYLGYIIMSVGLLLADATIALTVLVLIQAGLFVWRARLEEKRLAQASPEYREYRAKTGFLFPRMSSIGQVPTPVESHRA